MGKPVPILNTATLGVALRGMTADMLKQFGTLVEYGTSPEMLFVQHSRGIKGQWVCPSAEGDFIITASISLRRAGDE